ncbi:Malonyl-coenzyme A:anthocyanin 3-O-glucoside-6''-O-malonyltransferase [Morus notabilis]|uniref:Malonyl-coenzyme A:anthocyanin 3-O-glucoside-6''-O-malonyltransferase n=1 Tax=Morus notabilis TaxID=981085 RepID=W9RW54_9ROSA|nr:Malonyl-coenzyme A:anthocyanin 3-O-glucoside-6''-O-malonyltransferase [Morus notabilis]
MASFCQHATSLLLRIPSLNPPLLRTRLPSLKHSLSLTLQHFFPFAANLILPPPPMKPHILFAEGDSAVSLTVAESAADFHFLSANHPRPVRALDPFVPKLAPARVDGDTRVEPIMALQFTVFPNSGICIGLRCNHVAGDARSLHHFMKSWALVCKTGGDLTSLDGDSGLPSLDRTAVKDPYGLELVFLKAWWSLASTWKNEDQRSVLDTDDHHSLRATVVLCRDKIERLRHWITNQLANDNENSTTLHMSSFVVISALIWVCLAKSEERNSKVNKDDDDPYYFAFVEECRSRLEFPLPTTYFGNCLTVCFALVKAAELLGENGVATAAKAIGKEVGELNRKPLKELENFLIKFKKIKDSGWKHVTVVGSPKFDLYETDFGWGRPKKCESIHFRDSTAFLIAQSRDEKGGAEVSLVLSKDQMSRFNAILEEILMGLV